MELALEALRDRACPSIRCRVRRDICGENPDALAAEGIYGEIIRDPLVSRVISWRQPDGWLGEGFHSGRDPETGIRILIEKGLRSDHPIVSSALAALRARPVVLVRGMAPLKILDDMHLGGYRMMCAAAFAHAGVEDEAVVAEQIDEAITGFRFAANATSVADVARDHGGKLVFRDGARWPSLYHLRLLAFTQSWRTPGNMAMVTAAAQRLVEFSPVPYIRALHKSQYIAPAASCMSDVHFAPDMASLSPQNWYMWFHRMEMLARLGVISGVPALADQVERLSRDFLDRDGFFTLRLAHRYFTTWSAYCGLALEPDWKSPWSRTADLTLRSALILHHTQLNRRRSPR